MQTPTVNDSASSDLDGDGMAQAPSFTAKLGEKANAAIDDKRDAIASGLDSAASVLREKADVLPGGEKIAGAAFTAAAVMETTADYVRDHDLEDILADLRQIVKNHPGATLLIAGAAGFLLARGLSRSRGIH